MPKRARATYAFARVPLDSELDGRWKNQSFLARSLGKAIWSLRDGAPVSVAENWEVSICKDLCIDGPERPNVVRALRRLADAGLLRVRDGSATCLLLVCAQSAPSLTAVCAVEVPVTVHVENDRGEERRVEERRGERDARAATAISASRDPGIVGLRWLASALGRDTHDLVPLGSFPTEYTWIGGRPELERAAVAKAIAEDPWCQANRARVDAPHCVRHWQKYLAGPVKPVVRAAAPDWRNQREAYDAAKEAYREARIELNRLLDASWDIKEHKLYPEQLAHAKAQVAKTDASLAAFRKVAS